MGAVATNWCQGVGAGGQGQCTQDCEGTGVLHIGRGAFPGAPAPALAYKHPRFASHTSTLLFHTCVGHAENAGPVVAQRFVEFVLKLAAPDRLAAGAVT